MDSLSTGPEACRTRSIEHCQADTLRDVLTGSERFVRTLPSSRGSTSPSLAGGCSSTFGQRPVLRQGPVPFSLWITSYPQVKSGTEIKNKSRPSAQPLRAIDAGRSSPQVCGRRQGPVPPPAGRTLQRCRSAHELGIQWATRESYGIAVTVRASSSLFSLRRCVSKRSPTLKDVTFWKFRPVRL